MEVRNDESCGGLVRKGPSYLTPIEDGEYGLDKTASRFLSLVIEGTVEGRRPPRRPKIGALDRIRSAWRLVRIYKEEIRRAQPLLSFF